MSTIYIHDGLETADSLYERMSRLVGEIRMVSNEVCIGDLTGLALGAIVVCDDEPLSGVIARMHAESAGVVRVQRTNSTRDLIVPLERMERELATPFGQPIFLRRPIGNLLDAIEYQSLGLSHLVTIHEACALALARDETQRNDPVLVCEPDASSDWAISVHDLLYIQSCVLRQVLDENERQRTQMVEAERAGKALQSELGVASRKAALAENVTRLLHTVKSSFDEIAETLSGGEEPGDDPIIRTVERIVERNRVIISDTLEETSKIRVLESLSCATLWREALMIEKSRLDAMGVEVVEQFDPCPLIQSDHQLMLRALAGLISSARQSIEREAGDVHRIVLSMQSAMQSGVEGVRLSVRDTGVGIAGEHLVRVFDADFMTKQGGFGFGLHDASQVVDCLGGAIWAESEGIGRGACFHIFLPMRAPDEQDQATRRGRAA